MTPCPKCGTHSDGQFCPNCGAQVVAQAAPSYQPQQPPQVPYPQQQPVYPQQPPVYPQQPQQPYPGIHYTTAPPPKQGSSWWKWLLGIVGGVIGLFILLIVAAAFVDDTPTTPDKGSTSAAKAISDITITDKVDPQTQEPKTANMTTVSARTPAVYAVVIASLKQGQVLSAQWFVNGVVDKDFRAEIKADKDYTGVWASFLIKQKDGKPFTPGAYKVILYLDGKAVGQADFTVK